MNSAAVKTQISPVCSGSREEWCLSGSWYLHVLELDHFQYAYNHNYFSPSFPLDPDPILRSLASLLYFIYPFVYNLGCLYKEYSIFSVSDSFHLVMTQVPPFSCRHHVAFFVAKILLCYTHTLFSFSADGPQACFLLQLFCTPKWNWSYISIFTLKRLHDTEVGRSQVGAQLRLLSNLGKTKKWLTVEAAAQCESHVFCPQYH